MPSEIRVDAIKSTSGLGTVTVNSSGQVLSGITTIESLSAKELALSTYPFIEMGQTISQDYTIGTSRNALTAGPVTINDNITVTIPSGSNWTIV